MDKIKSNKKKIIIVIISVLAVIASVCTGAFIWYSNSPFPTAVKLASAVKEKDIDAMLECIEPETSQKIELLMSITGISAEDLTDKFLFAGYGEKSDNTSAENNSVKFADYERNGDSASVSLTTGSGEEKTINFVRISGTWYLTLG